MAGNTASSETSTTALGAQGGTAYKNKTAGDKKNGARWLLPYTSRQINRVYLLSLAICLAFLALGLIFILYSSKLSRQETVGYIEHATRQITYAVDEHIRKEFQNLMAAATVAESENLLSEDITIHSLIKGLGEYNRYVVIGLADSSGQAQWRDNYGRHHRGDRSGDDFISQALTGKNVLTDTRRDAISGIAVNYYAVPVYSIGNGRIKGVLFAADREDELRTITEHSLYIGKGLAHIINSNGEYVVMSDSDLVISLGGNIFNLAMPLDAAIVRQIRENLAAGRSGHLEKSFYGQERLTAYAPLDINDWFVFYAIPEEMVSAGLKNMTICAVAVISIALAVYILFIVFIRQINNHSRRSLETLAFTDQLTGKRNYQKFLLDASEALNGNKGERYALCYSDIKDFRYINNLFGRTVGDHLLRYWADFLDEMTQPGEIFGRVGADVFVELRKYHTRQEMEARFASIKSRLAVFPEFLGHGYKVEVYAGIYVIEDDDENLSLSAMLDLAISAQKIAKTQNTCDQPCFYSHEMGAQKLWETEVEAKMEAALEHNEFQMYLQPKIDIQHHDRIMGAEALVRWVSPEKGIISPQKFIHIFEQNGFIVKLDRFMFAAACDYYQNVVLKEGLPLILSVNVSRLSLMQPGFVQTYKLIKEEHGIPDNCLELEFTESLVFENHALFSSIVSECKHSGFLCSLDDFGSGYSALNLLRSIHVDVLKLDRSFFMHDDEAERGCRLVENIVNMAKALDMKTVAEGVDSRFLLEQLRHMGCDMVQGYVFAKPMPAEEFTAFAQAWDGNGAVVDYTI